MRGGRVVIERLYGLGCEFVYSAARLPLPHVSRYVEGGIQVLKIESRYLRAVAGGEDAFNAVMSRRLAAFRCVCGAAIRNTSVLRLPSLHWRELIDCWSCHNREFSTMLGREMRPRKGGVLFSYFYLVAERGRLCVQREKIFYNELPLGVGSAFLLYHYFREAFQTDKCQWVRAEGRTWKVKYLEDTAVYIGQLPAGAVEGTAALKVMFREDAARHSGDAAEEKHGEGEEHINEHYSRELRTMLCANSTGTFVGTYEVSYITPRDHHRPSAASEEQGEEQGEEQDPCLSLI